jgi:hypothetical protein
MRVLAVALSLVAAGAIAGCGDPGIQIVVDNQSSLCLRANYTLGAGGQAPLPLVVPPGQTGMILDTLGSAPTSVTISRPDRTELGVIRGPNDGVFLVTVNPDLTLSGESRGYSDPPLTGIDFAPDTTCHDGTPVSPSQRPVGS